MGEPMLVNGPKNIARIRSVVLDLSVGGSGASDSGATEMGSIPIVLAAIPACSFTDAVF
jgi:hypothetical protein